MTEIKIVKGDISKADNVEAIINASNHNIEEKSMVDQAIKETAGPELIKECQSIERKYVIGDNIVTRGYQLKVPYVIHACCPVWQGGKNGEEKQLEDCYWNVLCTAKKFEIRSLMFPSISTGVCRFPIQIAAEVAVTTIKEYITKHPDDFDLIEWALFDDHTKLVYQLALDKVMR